MKKLCVKVLLFFTPFQSFCTVEDDLYQMYSAIVACHIPDRDRSALTDFRAKAAKKRRAKKRHTALYGLLLKLCDVQDDYLNAAETLHDASWDDKAGLILVTQVARCRVELAQQEVEYKLNKSFRRAQRVQNVRIQLRSKRMCGNGA